MGGLGRKDRTKRVRSRFLIRCPISPSGATYHLHMSSYPTATFELDHRYREDLNGRSEVDQFFVDFHLSRWHPETFAKETMHTSFDPFHRSIASITRARLGALSAYTGAIQKYIASQSGQDILKGAESIFQLRKVAKETEDSHRLLQGQYMTNANKAFAKESKKRG